MNRKVAGHATPVGKSDDGAEAGVEPSGPASSVGGPYDAAARRRGRRTLLAVLAVCIAPVIASYLAYYWYKPTGRTNYGDLILPQRDVTAVSLLPLVVPDPIPGERRLPVVMGTDATLAAWRGRWVMAVAAPAACDADCQQRLYKIRQVRLTTGKHRNRIERLWLVTDPVTRVGSDAHSPDLNEKLLAEHKGIWVAAVSATDLDTWFPVGGAGSPEGHIYLVDPLGNLMMRFPFNADPSRMKKDLNKLLKASRIG